MPKPEPYEWGSFIPLLLCGLSYPIHPFFHGLLHFYGLQMQHLTPNSILHIACFITLCECFLFIEPHFGFWRKYFQVKLQMNMNETCECGGAAICKQSGPGCLAGEFVETKNKAGGVVLHLGCRVRQPTSGRNRHTL